jgi:adenylate kinase
MRLVFLGPPGVGKGTHADILAKDLKIKHYSTGDIFREILKESSLLSKKLEKYVNSGELVPDEIVFETIQEVLSHSDSENGWLLDGYPRNKKQAELLDDFLEANGKGLDWAVYLYAPDEVLIKRLTSRRICGDCGAIYNLVNSPPKIDNICDKCGGNLIQRDDDNIETIERRITIFEEEFEPLREYYEDKGILVEVLSEGNLENIASKLKEGLQIG